MRRIYAHISPTNDDCLYVPQRLRKGGHKCARGTFMCCQSMAGEISNPNRFKDLTELAADSANDALQAVTFVEPRYQDDPRLGGQQATDNHPPASMWGGEAFLKKVYDALSQCPSWDSTVMILTYDEHGSFFDHVPPPPIPAPGQNYPGFDTTGVRVPTIVVSPFVPAGGVSHAILDHTSILRFLAELYGHVPYNDQVAARAGVVSLSEVLDDNLLATGANTRPAPSMT